jgi:serine/threonine protein kinase
MTTPTIRLCGECGKPVAADGGCPVCALKRALALSGQAAEAKVIEQAGDRVGRYKLLEKIGEGGCGIVYMAEQTEPVRRRVAFKIVKLGMDTRQVIARFEAERQAMALMDHPNIAKVLDAGATDTGRPYFVMELVRGIKITDYCDQNNLSTRERLDLFIKVCQAVQHAHQKGIIHRDIKPSNILVTLHDGVPVPKVIDFGIAKATQQPLTDKTLFTSFQQFIGTPAYMSPEQAELSGLDIDTRSDIYALGVLLYELLTGKVPFDAKDLLAAGLDEMRRVIREQQPPKPSTRLSTLEDADLSTVASHRRVAAPALIDLVRGDLDWIVMKCLEKDRTRRYETANGVASEIKRFLNNETVEARPPSSIYRFQKLVRRHRLVSASVASFLISISLALALTGWALLRERAARAAEQIQRRIVQHQRDATFRFIAQVFENSVPRFRDLIGATPATDSLTHDTVAFLEALPMDQANSPNFFHTLASIYLELSHVQGNPYAANSMSHYAAALTSANSALRIANRLLEISATDGDSLSCAIDAEDSVGSLLLELKRFDEARKHFRRESTLVKTLVRWHPEWTRAAYLAERASVRMGNLLKGEHKPDEALKECYLPVAARWFAMSLDESSTSQELHIGYVMHALVSDCQEETGDLTNALAHVTESVRLKTILCTRQPNDARDARDLPDLLARMGSLLVYQGRISDGLAKLDEALKLGGSLAERDPANGEAQRMVADLLYREGRGYRVAASEAGISQDNRIWRLERAKESLDRCRSRLLSLESRGLGSPINLSQDKLALEIQELRKPAQ